MNCSTYFSLLTYKMHNIYTSIISYTYFLQQLPEKAEVRHESRV